MMKKSFVPVNKGNLTEQIMETITDAIIQGQFQAGTKLPSEYELMEQLCVSRNSLREAMKILSAMGIVEIRRGDGTYVCSQIQPSLFDSVVYSIIYDLSTNAELLELRRVIDMEVMRLAMEKITEEDAENIWSNIRQMEEAIAIEDYAKTEELDYEYHLMLIDVCRNKFFERMMKSVYGIFEKSIINTVEYEKRSSKVVQHHKNILNCILNKEADRVKEVVEESLETWQKQINR